MSDLTRRCDPNHDRERWLIYCGDVRVGHIGQRGGLPHEAPPWAWACGFYPGTEPGAHSHGSAVIFDEARAAFERAWQALAASRDLGPAFKAWRDHRAFDAWKRGMWATGCKLPTQVSDGRSRCFCGTTITIAATYDHALAHRAA